MPWKDPEKRREFDRQRNQRPERKESEKLRARRNRAEHPERNAAACKKWEETHREAYNAKQRRYRRAHPQYWEYFWLGATHEEIAEIVRFWIRKERELLVEKGMSMNDQVWNMEVDEWIR